MYADNIGHFNGMRFIESLEDCGSVFKPVLILLLGGCLIGTGIWIMFFTARRCGLRAWCYGVAMVIGGYLFAIFGGIIFACHLPEYASTAPGIDASAPPSHEGFARR